MGIMGVGRSTSPLFSSMLYFLPQTQSAVLSPQHLAKQGGAVPPIEWEGQPSLPDGTGGASAQWPDQGESSGGSNTRMDYRRGPSGELSRQRVIPLPGAKASCPRGGWCETRTFFVPQQRGTACPTNQKLLVGNGKLSLLELIGEA